MQKLSVKWVKCEDDRWCSFRGLQLNEAVDVTGVYVIFDKRDNMVIRLGQGNIKDRISSHRNNEAIRGYSEFNELLVTWAVLPESYFDGVERYLADMYRPLIGENFPDVAPIAINLPV